MNKYEVVYEKWYGKMFPRAEVTTIVEASAEDEAMNRVIEMVHEQGCNWIVERFISVRLIGGVDDDATE